MSDFFNVRKQYEELQNAVARSVKTNIDVDGVHRKLQVESVEFKGTRRPSDFKRQRDTKDRGGTWGQTIKANVSLRDKKTNKLLKRQKVTIGVLPSLTGRYSYIVGGREYQVTNQFRRMSGVYTRIADNGEFQAVAVNERKGQLKMKFDPNTRLISVMPLQGNPMELNMYILLRGAGRTDAEIEKAWGKGIVAANKAKYTEVKARKRLIDIAKRVEPASSPMNGRAAAAIIMRHLRTFTFDKRITNDVLGKPYGEFSEGALMDSGTQLVKMSKGEVEQSTYDNLGHKKFLSAPDLLEDYMNRKSGQIKRRIKNKVDREVEIDKIIRTNTVGREINRFFREGAETRLSSEATQVNPTSFYTNHAATTIKGFGGITVKSGMSTGTAQTVHSSQIGILDPIDTGEKLEAGIDLPLSLGAVKKGQRVYVKMYSTKTGKIEEVDPLVADRSYVAYPDDVEFVRGKPKALKARVKCVNPNGKFESVPLSKVDYIITSGQNQFGLAVNMVPFLGNNNGNRVMMGAKQFNQTVGLLNREAPLVQVATSQGSTKTFERALGNAQALICREDGKVTSVTKDYIKVKSGKKTQEYPMYNLFQTNDKRSFLHHRPLVKVGDRVTKGQTLADMNFTRNGTLATGVNLEMAYVPMKGYNFEDGIVVSRTATEKLTSEHLHKIERDCTYPIGKEPKPSEMNKMEVSAIVISKKQFMSWAGQTARSAASSIDKIGDDGIIKQGVTVEKGDLLIAAVRKRQTDDTLKALKKSTRFNAPWVSAEVKWDKDVKGKVARVVKSGKSVTVYVYTQEKLGIGDKLAGRYGNKGIVTKILEDHEMPFYTDKRTGEKKHIEVAMHPAAVPGRMNPGQLLEVAASKIAEKTGKPYIATAFDKNSKDTTRELLAELKKHGLSDEEVLTDPETGKEIGSVITGKHYTQKLEHMVDKKMTARAGGPAIPGLESYGYDLNGQPVQGYPSGGQAAGGLGIYALLGHNARANIRDLQTHKSTYERAEKWGDYDSDDYWLAMMSGTPLPAPKPTFAVKKFESYIKGMGINPKRNGGEIQLIPMGDEEVLKQCSFEVKSPNKFIDGKKGMPEKGGLFDFPEGQVSSSRWGHIKLKNKVVNPVFEEASALLLGVTLKTFKSAIKGKEKLPNGKTGMQAIVSALNSINVTAEIEKLENEVKAKPAAERDKIYKRLKLLKALKRMNMSPGRAYTMGVMPVLPPNMRPVGLSSEVGAVGDVETVDINHLYRQVGMANELMRSAPKGSPKSYIDELDYGLYETIKNAYTDGGLNNRGAPISSLMQTITNPKAVKGQRQGKEGFFQRKVISRRSDLSGRSVITVEPDLNLDQVGMPRKMVLQIYRPFIVRELKASGYSRREAVDKLRTDPKSPIVSTAVERAIKTRPVLMKRDPALHKFSIMAFYPKIVEGKAIKIHPMVVGGFNADFDGDTMAAFVPSSDDAVEEARNMVPSKNLIGTKNFSVMNTPTWDFAYGIWQMTELRKDIKKNFATPQALVEANKQGKVKTNDVVRIRGKKTCAGRAKLYSKMSPELQKVYGDDVLYGKNMTANRMKDLLNKIAKTHPGLFTRMADAWKLLGANNAYADAWSYGLKDHKTYSSIRDKHLKAADKKVASIRKPTDADRIRIYGEAGRKIKKDLHAAMKKDGNRLWRMTGESGAIKRLNQVEQMISSPIQVMDMEGKVVPEPVRKSYAEGFSSADYWTTIPGVRAGTLSRARGTAEPGAVGKSLINLAINLTVTEKDCGTQKGIPIATDNIDIESRYLPTSLKVGSKTYPRNTLITPEIAAEIRKKHKVIEVRSTMYCKMTKGVCQYCSGERANGGKYEFGENVGVNSAHSLSEPTTQMSMNAFHTGGSAEGKGGAESIDEFGRLSQLWNLPKTLPNATTISRFDGRVSKIEKDKEAGGHFVTINGEQHRVSTGLTLKVKVGDRVKVGDPLSYGPVNPHDLLEHAGLEKTRKYLVEELHKVYSNHGVRRRHTEALVRQMTNVVEVISDPEHEFAPGDFSTRTRISNINAERTKNGDPVIKVRPKLKRIQDSVLLNSEGDFLAAMNYREIQKTFVRAATYGEKSDLHGTNPIPGVAYGAEFGKGKKPGTY